MEDYIINKFGVEDRSNLLEKEINEAVKDFVLENNYPFATLEEVLDHFDRVVEIVGIDQGPLGAPLICETAILASSTSTRICRARP